MKLQNQLNVVRSLKFPIKITISPIITNGLLSMNEIMIADVTFDGGGFASSGSSHH
jgi:hypothetical protein